MISMLLLLVCVSRMAGAENISLNAGWNSLGLNITSATDSVAIPGNVACWQWKDSQFGDCAAQTRFNRGAAIWAYSESGTDTIVVDHDPGAPAITTLSLSLKLGWNHFSIPFDVPVIWNDQIIVNGQALSASQIIKRNPVWYDGNSYQTASRLEKGKGYFIYAKQDAVLAITVPGAIPVLSVAVRYSGDLNFFAGETGNFTSECIYYGETAPRSCPSNAVWSSSNSAVGNIDSSGRFTANASGTAVVKVSVDDLSDSVEVRVLSMAPAAAFSVQPESDGNTLTEYTFDASMSSDPQDPAASLQVQWDWDSNGVYDTEYSAQKTATHTFSAEGLKTITMQVKNTRGFTAAATRAIYVAQAPDPGVPGEGGTPYHLSFEATDVKTDAARNKMYVTDIAGKRLYFINLATGQVEKYFNFSLMPERMAMSPDGNRLYVALLTQEHKSGWHDADEHEGYIGVFDLNAGAKLREMHIAEDPYDLLAAAGGKLVVSGGSGFQTHIKIFDAATGVEQASVGSVYDRSRLALHPNGAWLYSLDTGYSPAFITLYDISGAGIVKKYSKLSPEGASGNYPLNPNFYMAPSGNYMIRYEGDALRVTGAEATDQAVMNIMTTNYITHLVFDATEKTIFTVEGSALKYYNLDSTELIGSISLSDVGMFAGVSGAYVYAVRLGFHESFIDRFAHPCLGWGTNTAPVAAFSVQPGSGGNTLTEYNFDAGASSDAEDPPASLQVRWDWESDGVYDTSFSAEKTATHTFDFPGTKTTTMQVKDTKGLVATATRVIDVAQGVDTGVPGQGGTPYQLSFAATDVITDAAQNKMYVTDKAGKRLYFVNLATGQVEKYFNFILNLMPERMAVTPDGSRLYVALLTREHSTNWDDGGHEGYVAEFDLNAGTKLRYMRINEDPAWLAVTAGGKLVVSSGSRGSSDFTYIRVYNVATGEELGNAACVLAGMPFSVHPNGQWVYVSVYDSAISKYSISGPGISWLYDSPYNYGNSYRIDRRVFVTPGGDKLIARGGDMFNATGVNGTDMAFAGAFATSTINNMAFDTTEKTIFTVENNNALNYYNLATELPIGSIPLSGAGSFTGVSGAYVYAVRLGTGVTYIDRFAHPCPGCGANTAPVASFTVQPASGGNTLMEYNFDAGASSDAEDPAGSLQVRWDWDSDGAYDTSFSAEKTATHTFYIAGTKTITMQIRDTKGLTATAARVIEVAQGVDTGVPGQGGTPYQLPFAATDVKTDVARNKMYMTDKAGKRVYFVNLATGLVEKYFNFTMMPERMAISPDGSRMYVAVLTREHSSYWWYNDGHEGYIAEFDLNAGTLLRYMHINEDPYDLLVAAGGKLLVSGGSGQGTLIWAYNVTTGEELGNAQIEERSRMALHPNGIWLYTANADNGLVAPALSKFDISGPGIVKLYDSSMWNLGSGRMNGNVYAAPDGHTLITRGGGMFYAAADYASDMAYVSPLTDNIINHLVFDVPGNRIYTAEGSALKYYNLTSYEPAGSIELSGTGNFIGVTDLFLYAIRVESAVTYIDKFPK